MLPEEAREVAHLRWCFRNLLDLRELSRLTDLDVIKGPDGTEIALAELERLCARVACLSPRQRQAIETHLIRGMRQKDVAIMMGLAPSNPIGLYATVGLRTLLGHEGKGRRKPLKPRPLKIPKSPSKIPKSPKPRVLFPRRPGPARLDLSGQRFGMLVAISPVPESRNGSTFWVCRCDCGNDAIVSTGHLRSATKSCGCRSRGRYARKAGQN